MRTILMAIWAEYYKIRKSKILFITFIIFIFIPMMLGLMMFVSQNPEIAAKLGMFGTKAKMFGGNDWIGFLSLMNQANASIGFIGFGFVTSWVFGREHTEKTMKDLIALPVSRGKIVFAKFIITFIWCILLALTLFVTGILLGRAMNLPGWSVEMFSKFSYSFIMSTLLTLLLSSPVAFLAGYSRGILAPIGFLILTLIMAQFIGVVGLGPYFPWAIPGLFSVHGSGPGMEVLPVSYIILGGLFILCYMMTVRWWKNADHH